MPIKVDELLGWGDIIIGAILLTVLKFLIGMSCGVTIERDEWKASKRRLDQNSCVWIKNDNGQWYADNCYFKDVPIPEKTK